METRVLVLEAAEDIGGENLSREEEEEAEEEVQGKEEVAIDEMNDSKNGRPRSKQEFTF